MFAGDGQGISQWSRLLEAAGVPSTMIVGVHGLVDVELRLQEYSPVFDAGRFAAHERFSAVFAGSPGAGYEPTGALPSRLPRTYLVAGTLEPFFLDNATRWAVALREAGADVRAERAEGVAQPRAVAIRVPADGGLGVRTMKHRGVWSAVVHGYLATRRTDAETTTPTPAERHST